MRQEEQIIRRCQQGDRQAMGQLYTMMHDELLSVCRHYVADDSTAEDLLHDAFLLIFSKIGDLHAPKKARAWMRKVVKNVALLYAEKQGRMPTVPLDQVGDLIGPDFDVPYAALNAQLMDIIDTLPEGYRRVLRLSVLEGLSHQEIADLLNIEPHSSSSQLHRAKRMLHRSLAILLLSLLVLLLPLGIWHWKARTDETKGSQTADRAKPSDPKGGRIDGTPVPPLDGGDAETPPPTPPLEGRGAGAPMLAQKDTNTLNEQRPADDYGTAEHPDTLDVPQPTDESGTATVLPSREDDRPLPLKGGEDRNRVSDIRLSLACSTLPSGSSGSLPYGNADFKGDLDSNGDVDSTSHHRLPLTIALNASYRLTPRLWLNGGIGYTLLSSDHQVGNTYLYYSGEQRIHYLGITLGAGYDLLRRGPLSLYGQASATLDLPLRGKLTTTYFAAGQALQTEESRLQPKSQWSLGVGMGLQYNFTPTVGLFAEPTLRYHFNNGDGLETWRTSHPAAFSLPVGIRINF